MTLLLICNKLTMPNNPNLENYCINTGAEQSNLGLSCTVWSDLSVQILWVNMLILLVI